jgi:hypothetical protein
MKWVTQSAGQRQLYISERAMPGEATASPWATGGTLAPRSVHELLFASASGHAPPTYLALQLAAKATAVPGAARAVVWFDPHHTFYPPAILPHAPLKHLCVLRPREEDLLWAVTECLRCAGVGAVIAAPPARMTRVEARRLQLAAEQGGGVGVLLRPDRHAGIYAAATRWKVRPAPGDRGVQRWEVQCIHGHGRQSTQSFYVENRREADLQFALPAVPLRATAALADRPPAAQAAAASG